MATATAASCTYRVQLPSEVAENYEKQATVECIPVEEWIGRRLASAVHHTSTKPLYVSDEQRQKLEVVLGRNLHRPKDLVEAVERLGQIRVENVKVLLSPDVMERLKSRHFTDEPFDVWLAAKVREWAEQEAGLR